MPNFKYKARDQSGKSVKGVLEAASEDQAMRQVDALGLIPLEVEKTSQSISKQLSKTPSKIAAGGGRKARLVDIIVMSRQLVTLLQAGVPILGCMNALVAQAGSPALRLVLEGIQREVAGGAALSAAFAQYPKTFSPLYIATIRAGETGGVLPEVLGRLAEMLENDLETTRSVKAAVRYPIMVIVALTVAFFVLISFVVPRFAALFARFDTQLPLPTRILIAINSALTDWWYVFFPTVGLAGFAFYAILQTQKGRFAWDKLVLRMPVFGNLVLKMSMARFARMFSTLYRSGVPVLRVIEIVSQTLGNTVMGAEVAKMAISVRQGQGLAEPLRKSPYFPPMVIQMLSVGEKSGSVDEMLGEVSKHYESETKYIVGNLTSLIEPMLIVGLGGVVLLLALGIFLPMWNMIKLYR